MGVDLRIRRCAVESLRYRVCLDRLAGVVLSRDELVEYLAGEGIHWQESVTGDIVARGVLGHEGRVTYEGEEGFSYARWEAGEDWYPTGTARGY